jgi:hypothetical protein
MALIVEDSTGKADAESYVSIADIAAYATSRGLTFAITGGTNAADAEAAARRATTWLDAYVLPRLACTYRTHQREQALQWPRINVFDREGNAIASDEIPQEIIAACCEAAVREKATPGILSPDVTPGQIAKSERVDTIAVEYFRGGGVADQRMVMTIVDDILAPLLGARPSPYFGKSVRG